MRGTDYIEKWRTIVMLTREDHKTYAQILREELTPAFGCTEPIALAYCAAKAREVLGQMPTEVIIEASGNIIKNVKSVIVPNTGGMKGIPAAAAAGIVAGDSKACLEVIAKVTPEEQKEIAEYLKNVPFSVKAMEDGDKLDIRVTVKTEENSAVVRVSKHHTDIVYIACNGEVMLNEQDDCECAQKLAESQAAATEQRADRSRLSIEGIVEYAKTADLSTVSDLLNRQIEYNYTIAQAGVKENWGANVGSVLLDTYGEDVRTKARAYAAAGSDARMSGCELPVVINSGSGNQGITVSVPVIIYAKEYHKSDEELLRALLVSNLIAIHIKTGIGPLSAFCGAVSAGCAAGCAIAFLLGGGIDEVAHTLVNSIAITSGIICDGAKPSCAAKIASSVDAGILGYEMYRHGQQFYGEDGIVSKGVENTIHNICRIGAEGMNGTDEEIIKIMTHCD